MSGFDTSNPIMVNTEYCYEVECISKILEQRVLEEQLRNTFLIDPIFHQEKQLIQCLRKEKTDHQQSPNRTILISYLVVGYDDENWIGVMVKIANNTVQKVECFDSASKLVGEKLHQKLVLDFEKVYGNGIKLEAKIGPAEHCEAFSYGPYMIESLVSAAKGDYTNQFTTPFETRLHHIHLMNRTTPELNFYEKQKTNEDFECLKQIKKIAKTALNEYEHVYEHLIKISELVDGIRRDETNCKIIRNVHGYRNPTAKNRKNAKGAKLNFELLSYLKDLNKKDELEKQLKQTNKEVIEATLNKLIEKIDHILPKSSDSIVAPDSDLGFLEKIVSYYHDLDSLEKLLLRLEQVNEPSYATLDPAKDIDQYMLGYFFVELGEIAHDITDFIQPENANKTNLMRVLFSKLYALRNVPKNKPKKVRTACQNLFQMKFVIQEVNDDLRKILQYILDHLKSKLNYIGNANSNFHEFGSDNSELSVFEEKHKILIEAVIKILQIKDKNVNDSEVMRSLEKELSECDEIVVEKVTKVLENVKNNFTVVTQTPNAPSETHDKQIRKFVEIIDEIRFLQKLLAVNTSLSDEFKLSQAAKMSLAFVIDTFKKFDETQLNNPMLFEDFMITKKVRNNQIMHKIIYSKLNLDDAVTLIKYCIAPWLSDFIALFVCQYRSFFEKNQIKTFDYLLPILQYNTNKGSYTYDLAIVYFNKRIKNGNQDHQLLWFDFITIVAYKRLGFYDKIIKLYEEIIKSKLGNELTIDELAVAVSIEYQVADAYMYNTNLIYDKAACLFRNALGKSLQITVDNYGRINDFQKHIKFRLAFVETNNNQPEALREVLQEGIGVTESILLFKYEEELKKKELRLHYHRYAKDELELTFLPMLEYITIDLKLYVIFQLLRCYLNEFDMSSFVACLKLQQEIFENTETKYDVEKPAFIFSFHQLTTISSLKIILALCESTPTECNEQLKQIHINLSDMIRNVNREKREEYKRTVWCSSLFVRILLMIHPTSSAGDSEENGTYSLQYLRKILKVSEAVYRKTIRRNIVQQIAQIKDILHQKLDPTKTKDEKAKLKYQLVNMKRGLVGTYQKWAIKEYLKGDKYAEFASKILRRAFLFESSVDYLEFKWTYEPHQLSKLGIMKIDEENDIVQYTRYKLTSEETSRFDVLMNPSNKSGRHQFSNEDCVNVRFYIANESDDEYIDNFAFGFTYQRL